MNVQKNAQFKLIRDHIGCFNLLNLLHDKEWIRQQLPHF
jgi:hypothetical protein